MAAVPEIETERLLLRAHRPDDLSASLAIWAHPDVTRFIGGRPSTSEEVWWRLLRYAGLWAMLGYGYLAVVERASGRMVGDVGLADFKRATSPALGEVPEAGWALHPDFHGKGYALEAMRALLGWADAQGIERTCCIIDGGNAPSTGLAMKLGYGRTGSVDYHGNQLLLFSRNRA